MDRILSDNAWHAIAGMIVNGLDAAESKTTADPVNEVDAALLQEMGRDCDSCFRALQQEDWGKLREEMAVLLSTVRILLGQHGDDWVAVYSSLCVADGWVRWIDGEGE